MNNGVDSNNETKIVQNKSLSRKNSLSMLISGEVGITFLQGADRDDEDAMSSELDIEYNNKRRRFSSMSCSSLSDLELDCESVSTDESLANHIRCMHASEVHDENGYYIVRAGECIGGKYTAHFQKGKGTYSNVILCSVSGSSDKPVALKIIRNHGNMHRVGVNEDNILREIQRSKPACTHIIQYIEGFEHNSHWMMVFEATHMNLRQLLYKHGQNIGININHVRRYSHQILTALNHINGLSITHGDVKLDNILVLEDLRTIKLCDFGCAFVEGRPIRESTYIASRFYRAPEVILGLSPGQLGCAIDIWAWGACMYELYTGSVLFPGKTNNEMIKLIMKATGYLSDSLIWQHCGAYINKFHKNPYFDLNTGEFFDCTADEKYRFSTNPKTTDTIDSKLRRRSSNSTKDIELLPKLSEVLSHMLVCDPTKRISANEAMQYAFFDIL